MTQAAIVPRPDLLERLKQIVGPAGYRDGDDIEPSSYEDLAGKIREEANP